MPAGRPKTEASTYIRLYASLPPELLEDLHARAQAGNRPINNELVTVVRAGLQALKEQETRRRHRTFRPDLVDEAMPRTRF